LHPSQFADLVVGAKRWVPGTNPQVTFDFAAERLLEVLTGQPIQPSCPPDIDILCSQLHAGHLDEDKVKNVKPLLAFGRRYHVLQYLRMTYPLIPSSAYPQIFPLFHPLAADLLVSWCIPSSDRSGHILLSGLKLGAEHAVLQDTIQSVQDAKKKRIAFAETHQDREEMLVSVQDSEWNAEMSPLVLSATCAQSVDHDFTSGPCIVPVDFKLRNYSASHDVRYLLRLSCPDVVIPNGFLAPSYTGRKTIRGTLKPLQTEIATAKMWVARPGAYFVGCWQAQTEVLASEGGSGPCEGRILTNTIKHCYVEGPTADNHVIVNVNHRI